MKVIVVGGGWAGCAASLSASKQGAEVVLIERTDMLLGTGLVGGIVRNNGRFTAAEEMIAMEGGELFQLIDQNVLYRNIDLPGNRHASLYNLATMEPQVKKFLLRKGIHLLLTTRVEEVEMEGTRIKAVRGKQRKEDFRLEGDVFIDTTGTTGPLASCHKYGNGCALCILRCNSFGGRVSLAAGAGAREVDGRQGNQIGAMSGSCILVKESISREMVEHLEKAGSAIVAIPNRKGSSEKALHKACPQYDLPEFSENLVLLHPGQVRVMTPFFPLDALRQIPGFENARYQDPYAGGMGNSVRFLGMPLREDSLRVKGVENLFCAGEKAGLLVGHTEGIITGTLAGFNAVRQVKKGKPLILPAALAVGDIINYARIQMDTIEGLGQKYTFSGSIYFERMKQKGLYTTNPKEIQERVEASGMNGVFSTE